MDLAILSELVKIETQGIEKCENELGSLLAALDHLPGRQYHPPPEVHARVKWLLKKLGAAQEKVEGYERESGILKKVLQHEF